MAKNIKAIVDSIADEMQEQKDRIRGFHGILSTDNSTGDQLSICLGIVGENVPDGTAVSDLREKLKRRIELNSSSGELPNIELAVKHFTGGDVLFSSEANANVTLICSESIDITYARLIKDYISAGVGFYFIVAPEGTFRFNGFGQTEGFNVGKFATLVSSPQ